MPVMADLIRALTANGASPEAIAAAIEVLEREQLAKDEARREKGRDRVRRHRERKRPVTLQDVTDGDAPQSPPRPPPDPLPTPPLTPRCEGAGAAGARPLPSKSRFDEVEATCREALGKLAPIDLVIGPIVQLAEERDLRTVVLPAMIDAARSSRSPIRTWSLLAVKARERLDAPPIQSIPQANGAQHHGPHRKPTVSDVLRARLAQLEPNDGEPPMLAIGCH